MIYGSSDSVTCRYRKRNHQLRQELSSQGWLSHWKNIVEYGFPRRGRYLSGESTNQNNDGRKKNQKIINNSVQSAVRTASAGIHGGMTSPSRPWFALTFSDESLAEYGPVRDWLHDCQTVLLTVFARSNYYSSHHYISSELVGFGTAAMMIEEDMDTVCRFRPFTIGEFCLASDSRFRPESLYRQFSMTAYQMREQFGQGNDKMQNLPISVVQAIQSNNGDCRFEVGHVIEKNGFVDTSKADYRGMKFSSVYYPVQGDEDMILRKSGYATLPFIAPRWEVTGVDVYGQSPFMDALGDVQMLQKMEEKKLKKLDKNIDPPMNAPTSMRVSGGTIVAGGINYVDTQQGQQGFMPAYQTNADIRDMVEEVRMVEKRIERTFYNDLFLAALNNDRDITAYEMAKRYEEKLVMLGPVLERIQNEDLGPTIDRVFDIAYNLGIIPPPPPEIPPGMPIKVEYVSLLAQAQKMVGTASTIQQFTAFVGSIAPMDPSVIDKINLDEGVDQFGTALGVPPKMIRPDDEVKAIRDQKQRMQNAQMMAQTAPQLTGALKDAGTTPINDGQGTALDAMLKGVAASRK